MLLRMLRATLDLASEEPDTDSEAVNLAEADRSTCMNHECVHDWCGRVAGRQCNRIQPTHTHHLHTHHMHSHTHLLLKHAEERKEGGREWCDGRMCVKHTLLAFFALSSLSFFLPSLPAGVLPQNEDRLCGCAARQLQWS